MLAMARWECCCTVLRCRCCLPQALRVAIAELSSLKAGRQVYQQKCAGPALIDVHERVCKYMHQFTIYLLCCYVQ